MWSNLKINLFNRKKLFSSLSEFKAFEEARFNINLSRIHLCILVFLPLMIILSFFDIYFFNRLNSTDKNNIIIFLLHISLVFLCIAWIIYYKFLYSKLSTIYNKIIFYIFNIFLLLIGMLISIFNFQVRSEISAFIIVLFIISALLYLAPLGSIFTFGSAYLLLNLYIYQTDTIPSVKIDTLIVSTLTLIFCTVISYNIYIFYLNDYKNKLDILKSNEKLKELQNSKNMYFTNFSHELKTPLNIIYSGQQMIKLIGDKEISTTASHNSFNKYLKIIKQNTNRLSKLIQNLIDINKVEASCFTIKPINADIVKVVEDITLSTVPYIEDKGLSITFDTDCEEKIINFDPDMIERIILNLLSNSIKFTKNGGKIYVTINSTKEWIYISVKDTGIGIPENMLDSIFNRFQQVEDRAALNLHGSGIGLALVKSIIELHGGKITVKSTVNIGSEFTFSLPNKVTNEPPVVYSSLEQEINDQIDFEFSDITK